MAVVMVVTRRMVMVTHRMAILPMVVTRRMVMVIHRTEISDRFINKNTHGSRIFDCHACFSFHGDGVVVCYSSSGRGVG